MEDGTTYELSAGNAVFISHGGAHQLLSHPDAPVLDIIAQGGDQARGIAAGALHPAANDHGSHHVGQTREDTGEADTCGANLAAR